jgi:hypothetical protein
MQKGEVLLGECIVTKKWFSGKTSLIKPFDILKTV